MLFPGTFGVRDETYEMLLEDITTSLKLDGFTDIVMIGGQWRQSARHESGDRPAERTLAGPTGSRPLHWGILFARVGRHRALHRRSPWRV